MPAHLTYRVRVGTFTGGGVAGLGKPPNTPIDVMYRTYSRPVNPAILSHHLHQVAAEQQTSFIGTVTNYIISTFDRSSQAPTTHHEADAGDESLQRYKESLGLGKGKDLSDPNDPRVCIIQSLTMESTGREPVTIDLRTPGSESTLKDRPFKIKEGSKFNMIASFKVQHEILSGLKYVQVVKRGLLKNKDVEMIVSSLLLPTQPSPLVCRSADIRDQGSYAPNTDQQPVYTKKCKYHSSFLDLCSA